MGVRSRPCEYCGGELPVRARRGTLYCSTRCRVGAHRRRVPTVLRELDRWVTYSPAKVPLTPRGRPASVTDPKTWSRYSAVAPLDRHGFVLNGDGIVCLDLDHCLVDGALTERARAILDGCPRTYVEVSPSGTGLHVWGRGHIEHGRKLDGAEVYGDGRYITITGRRHDLSGSTLGDLTDVLGWLLAT